MSVFDNNTYMRKYRQRPGQRERDLAYGRAYRERHRDKIRRDNRRAGRERREEIRVKLAAYKRSRGCKDCGERDPVVLDCHHVDPRTKSRCVGKMVGGNWLWSAILRELAKCIILCANCHRRRHATHR